MSEVNVTVFTPEATALLLELDSHCPGKNKHDVEPKAELLKSRDSTVVVNELMALVFSHEAAR